MSLRPVLGLLALTALAAMATAFVGAGEGVGSDRRVVVVPPGAPVQIAFVGDDDVPAYTVSFEDAVRMAIAAHPSIDGHPVQIVDFHSTCNVPSASEDVARAVVADTQVVAVIGHLCSSGMQAALPTYERAGIVTVNGSTTVAGVLPALGPTVFNRLVVQEPDANGWYAAVQALPSDQAWQAAYAQRYGRPPLTYADLYFDSTNLLLQKLDQVARRTITDGLKVDGALLAHAVRNTRDYPGVSCDVTLDPATGNRVDNRAALAACAATAPPDASGPRV
jgi:ABC-type branched-subunit amino acid transport system substrate-binding protein